MIEAKNPEKTEGTALDQELGERKEAGKEVPEKTPEELQAQIKEYESKLGQAGQELGELRKRLSYVEEDGRRRDYELAARNLAREEKPEESPREEEFDYVRPAKSVVELTRKTIAEELQKQAKARSAYDQQMYQEYARKNYETGWRKASEKNPAIFDGVQSDVQDLIYHSFTSGRLGIDELADERVWERTAQLLWLEKGNVDKIVKSRKEPMRAGSGANLPEQIKPGFEREGVYGFDEKSKEIMKAFNLTEEDAKKVIDTEREEGGK